MIMRSFYIEVRVALVRLQFLWEDTTRHVSHRRRSKPINGPFMMRAENIELAEELFGPDVTFEPDRRDK